MKQYKYLYQKMLDEEIIRKAYAKMRKGKTKRKEIKYIDAHLEDEIFKMKRMIKNTKPCEVDHPEFAYVPIHHEPKIINEHGKERIIYTPEIHEQWLHHIIIQILSPIILSSAHPNACGSYPKRGAHYGKRKVEKWIHRGRGICYYAKMDIRHFYNNIRYAVLFRELRIRIKDEWFLHVIGKCLATFSKGLPLGYYISQWLANYLLEPIDFLIAKTFIKVVRYMDDIVVFGSTVRSLKDIINRVSYMLVKRFNLKLKGNYQVAKFDDGNTGRPLDFMGFVFFENRTVMRKTIMLRTTRLAKKLYRATSKGYRLYRKMVSGMLSRIGWFTCTDSYGCYLDRIKPYVNIGSLKKIISRIDRRRCYDRMERNKIFGQANRLATSCA